MVLVSCAKSTQPSTLTVNTTTLMTTITSSPKATMTITPTSTILTTTPNTTLAGNWWDSLGKPEYGGDLTFRLAANITAWDPYYANTMGILFGYMERIHTDDWTLNPSIYGFKLNFHPPDFTKGWLAASWELTNPTTYVVHLRQGIHWQNIPPANGREFTSADVVWNYDRMYALGGGFTVPSPYAGTAIQWQSCKSVTAPDKYTVVFTWVTANPEFIMETIQAPGGSQSMSNPEVFQQYGNYNDWHHAIGTGPYILDDFVSGASATLVKNSDYWGYDERYPQNKLPYIDSIKALIIPDNATALAALRTAKIDILDGQSVQTAKDVQKTNPKIVQLTNIDAGSLCMIPRNDMKPFNDINVRKAMQLAIDLPTIASSYYQGIADPWPSSLTSNYLTGWGIPYPQWPSDLKGEYAYNPTVAKQLLSSAGYPNGFKTDIIVDNAGDLDLLQIVKSYMAAVGIDMDIRPMDSASLTTALRAHNFDQIGMRASGDLGVSYEPLTQFSKFAVGNSSNFGLVNDPVFQAYLPKALADTNVADIKQLLVDCDLYVARQHYSISFLTKQTFALYQPWLKGYNGQTGAFSGSSAGPLFLAYYGARYWIDTNLKKSMGN